VAGRRLQTGTQCHGENGAAAVEFALVSVLLFMLVFGIVQYGFYFWASQAGSSAVRDAARHSAVGSRDCSDLRSGVVDQLGGAAVDTSTTTTRSYSPAPATVGDNVTITVTYQALDIGFPLIPVPDDGQITQTAQARVEHATAKSQDCT